MLAIRLSLSGIVALSVVLLAHGAHADRGAARVHVASKARVALERRESAAASWQPLCVAPCDRDLPLDGEYHAVFDTGDPGEPFRLEPNGRGEVELQIEPRSRAKKVAGIVMVGVGAPVAVGGAVGAIYFVALSAASNSPYAGIGYAVATVSGLIGLVGTGVLLGGLGLMSSAEPQTTQEPRPPRAAYVREPTWLGPRGTQQAASKPALFVPLSFVF